VPIKKINTKIKMPLFFIFSTPSFPFILLEDVLVIRVA
jgi:hypothetical protein